MAIDREPAEPAVVTAENIADAALPEAARALADVAKNEETRFSNLNTRAIALVSATSIVTTLAGVFSKDLIGKDAGSVFANSIRWIAAVGLVAAMALLVSTALFVTLGVLLPKQRLLFGDNDLLPRAGQDVAAQKLESAADVQRVLVSEYRQITSNLTLRNSSKASVLNKAYASFLAAIVTIALAAIVAVLARLP